MKDTEREQNELPQRLCSEIQLFDLCNLASCRFKSGRFCCNHELLERFEKIADEEFRSSEMLVDEASEDEDESGDNFGEFECDSEDDYERDEE